MRHHPLLTLACCCAAAATASPLLAQTGTGLRCQVWEYNSPPANRTQWLVTVDLVSPLPGYHPLPGANVTACGDPARLALDLARLEIAPRGPRFQSVAEKVYHVWINQQTKRRTVMHGMDVPGPGWQLDRPDQSCEMAHYLAYPPRPNDCRSFRLLSMNASVFWTPAGWFSPDGPFAIGGVAISFISWPEEDYEYGTCQVWERNSPPVSRTDWLTIVRLGDVNNPPPPGFHPLPGSPPGACGRSARIARDVAILNDRFRSICERSFQVYLNLNTNAMVVAQRPPGPSNFQLQDAGLCCEEAAWLARVPLNPASNCRLFRLMSAGGTLALANYYGGYSTLGPGSATVPSSPPIVLPPVPPGSLAAPDPAVSQYEEQLRQRHAAVAACDLQRALAISRALAQQYPAMAASLQSDNTNLESWVRYQQQADAVMYQVFVRSKQQGGGISDADRNLLAQQAAGAQGMPCIANKINSIAAQYPRTTPPAPPPGGYVPPSSTPLQPRYFHYEIAKVTGTDSGGNPRDWAKESEGDLPGVSGQIPVGYNEPWNGGHASMSGSVSIAVSGSAPNQTATISVQAQWSNAGLGISRGTGVIIAAGGREARKDLGQFTNGATSASAVWTGPLPASATIRIDGKQSRIVNLQLRERR